MDSFSPSDNTCQSILESAFVILWFKWGYICKQVYWVKGLHESGLSGVQFASWEEGQRVGLEERYPQILVVKG